MNGRIYDPKLGRFLQADPIVQFPHYSQSWNTWGISAAAFSAIGQHFSAVTGLAEGGLGHILTHGLAGGILAELQGGQFGHGFLAAGLSKAVMGRFSYADGSAPAVMGRTAIAATVGGTISRITGGKFANGALTSAMAQLFNAEMSAARAREGFVGKMYRTVENWKEGIKRGFQTIKDKYFLDFDRAEEIAAEMSDTMPGHNNIGDAKRHAEWSRRMHQEINPITSIVVGYGHELKALARGQPISEMLMDLHNNAVGRSASTSGEPVDQSQLMVIDPSDTATQH